jgi:hypothetical protein
MTKSHLLPLTLFAVCLFATALAINVFGISLGQNSARQSASLGLRPLKPPEVKYGDSPVPGQIHCNAADGHADFQFAYKNFPYDRYEGSITWKGMPSTLKVGDIVTVEISAAGSVTPGAQFTDEFGELGINGLSTTGFEEISEKFQSTTETGPVLPNLEQKSDTNSAAKDPPSKKAGVAFSVSTDTLKRTLTRTNGTFQFKLVTDYFARIAFLIGGAAGGDTCSGYVSYEYSPGESKPVDNSPPLKIKLTSTLPKLKQLVPGIEGAFDVEVTYNGQEPMNGAHLTFSTRNDLLSLLLVPGADPGKTVSLDVPPLMTGQSAKLTDKLLYRVGTEDVPEIFDKVIKTMGGTVPLAGTVQADLLRIGNLTNKPDYSVQPEVVLADGSAPKIEFPDFAKLVGVAGPVLAGETVTPAETAYNLNGDPGWSDRGNPEVRKLAIHAARYDAISLKFQNFPDSARKAADNMQKFIYRLLNPKSAWRDSPLRTDANIVFLINSGQLKLQDPKEEMVLNGYVCMEHAFFLTSLLRILGIPTKEANTILYKDVAGVGEARFQTAAAMAWVDDVQGGFIWRFLDPYMNLNSVFEYTGYSAVRTWYGVASSATQTFPVTFQKTTKHGSVAFGEKTTGVGNRFSLPDIQMDKSPLWKPLYPSDKENAPPTAAVITVHSPVRLAYRDSSGRTTGVVNGNAVIAEIPGSQFLPAGASIFINAGLPGFTLPDDVIVLTGIPAAGTTEGHVILTGTGNGSYTVEINQQANSQDRLLISKQGTVTQGQVVDYAMELTTSPNSPRATLSPGTTSLASSAGNTVVDVRRALEFDEWKFDEGVGLVANNATRPDRKGVLINGPAWASGKMGGALSFDGVDDYVNVPAALPSSGRAGAITFWFSLPLELSGTTSLHRNAIEGLAKEGSEGGHLVVGFNQSSIYSGSHAIEFGIHNGLDWSYVRTFRDKWTANTWYHVAVSWGTGGMKIYINGVLENTNPDRRTPAAFGTNFRIGQNSAFTGNDQGGSWYGLIDDVRVYERALSDTEVRDLYAVVN